MSSGRQQEQKRYLRLGQQGIFHGLRAAVRFSKSAFKLDAATELFHDRFVVTDTFDEVFMRHSTTRRDQTAVDDDQAIVGLVEFGRDFTKTGVPAARRNFLFGFHKLFVSLCRFFEVRRYGCTRLRLRFGCAVDCPLGHFLVDVICLSVEIVQQTRSDDEAHTPLRTALAEAHGFDGRMRPKDKGVKAAAAKPTERAALSDAREAKELRIGTGTLTALSRDRLRRQG